MMGRSKPSLHEVSILAVHGQESPKHLKKNNLWVDLCKKTNHTKDCCWKLHGKPPNWKDHRVRNQDPFNFHISTEISNQLGHSSK